MDGQKIILTPMDVAKEAGLCRKTVYKLLQTGAIAHIRAGEKILISRDNFIKWANGETKPAKNVS